MGRVYLLSIVAGVILGVAFRLPETVWGVLLGWLSVFLLTFLFRSPQPARTLWVVGVTSHLIAFSWLPYTMTVFGGLPSALSYLLFVLFCLVSSIQLAIAGAFARYLRCTGPAVSSLAVPLAWFTADFLLPKLFPWEIAHTQVWWSTFAGTAELTGTRFLSACMFWISFLCFDAVNGARSRRILATSAVVILAVGVQRDFAVRAQLAAAPAVTVGLVQGNLDLLEKRSPGSLAENLGRYRALSQGAIERGAELVVWPESVLNRPVEDTVSTLADLCEGGSIGVPHLLGGLSYEARPTDERASLRTRLGPALASSMQLEVDYRFFNTAFAVDGQCRILGRYHKRILMPFGEYMPLGERFPWLRKVSPNTGSFTAGTLVEPLEVSASAGNLGVRAMPLICYEDLIPEISSDAVRRGAQLLVNLTNDAWYGRSAAPYQHHLLAQWRAIETRRFLARATNTGLTAVVDPFGRTLQQLPIFEARTIVQRVKLLDGVTIYARFGAVMEWSLVAIAIAWLIPRALQRWFKGDAHISNIL